MYITLADLIGLLSLIVLIVSLIIEIIHYHDNKKK